MYCQKNEEKEETKKLQKPRGVSIQKDTLSLSLSLYTYFNAIKKFTKKGTMGLTTEDHCKLRKKAVLME